MKENRLKIAEVATLLECSVNTIESWYRFKRSNPTNKYAMMLPEPYKKDDALRATRYWKQSDIYKLIEFKTSIPRGKNGVMGCVTQKYVKKKGATHVTKKI